MTAAGVAATTETALAATAAGATATAATTASAAALALTLGTMFAATVAVRRMTLAVALAVVDAGGAARRGQAAGLTAETGLATTTETALAAAGATATTATTTTALTAFATAICGLAGVRLAGEGRLLVLRAFRGGRAEETFDPAEEAGGFLVGLTIAATAGGLLGAGSVVRTGGNRTAGRSLRVEAGGPVLAFAAGLLGTAVALLRTVAATLATTTAATTLAAASALTTTATFDAGSVATGVGSGFQHGNVAATHGAEHRTFALKGRSGGVGCRSRRGSLGLGGGGLLVVALVRESRRFPALGRMLHLGGREDVELGLGGGSSGFDDDRGGRDRSGGGSLREFSNNRSNRGRSGRSRSGRGRSNVRRSERVLIFRLRLQDLNGGGLVSAGSGGGVADGGRSGRSADAFAAREARAAVGAGRGSPIGGGRRGRTGGRGRVPGGRAAGRGLI